MPDDSKVDLVFPTQGVDRSKAYSRQPGNTSFDMLNVRPQSTLADRERGGRRPAVAEQYTLAGVSTPVRMLNQVRYISTSGQASVWHNFDTLGGWTAATFDNPLYTRPNTNYGGGDGADYANGDSFQLWPDDVFPYNPLAFVGNNFLRNQDNDPDTPGDQITYSSAMVHNLITPFNADEPYVFTLRMWPQPTAAGNQETGELGFVARWKAWYTLFLALDDNSPNIAQEGIALEWGFEYTASGDPHFPIPINVYYHRWRQYIGGTLAANSPGYPNWQTEEDDNDPNYPLSMEPATMTVLCDRGPGGLLSVDYTLRTAGNEILRDFTSQPVLTTQTRFGVGLNYDGPRNPSLEDRGVYLTSLTLNYKEHDGSADEAGVNINKLVAGANTRLWREDDEHDLMLTVGGSGEISDGTQPNNQQLMSVEYGGKLYIADSELVGTYTDGKINDGSFSSAKSELVAFNGVETPTANDLVDWDALGVDPDHHVVTITNRGTGNTLHRQDVAVYSIKSIKDFDATHENTILELGTFPHPDSGSDEVARVVREATAGAHNGISFRVERCGKVFDPATDAVSKWIQYDWDVALDGDGTTFDYSWLSASAYPTGDDDGPKGSIFAGAPIVASFLDRIWLAGLPENPNALVGSRKGDPYDWDFRADATDPAAAIGVGAGLAGRITQAITALVPVTDDYMLIGTHSQLYRMLGDPSFGGLIDVVSLTVGILDRFAWARGPQGETVFLTSDGLYALDPGAQGYPVRWSKTRMPRELININPREITISMAYDQQQEGFNIWLTRRNDAARLSWFVDYDTKGFFPEKRTYPSINPWVALEWLRDNGEVKTITGGSGGLSTGEIHYYDDSLLTDLGLGAVIENYVYLGPFLLDDDYHEGMISELVGKFPQSMPITIPTDPIEYRTITYSVAVGDTAEQAVDKAVSGTFHETGLFGPRSNPKARVRARGCYAVIKLESDGSPWAMETLTAIIRKMGIHKVLN